MRRARGMAHERVDAAQARGVNGDPHAVEEPFAVCESALELDREHPSRHPVTIGIEDSADLIDDLAAAARHA